MTTHNNETPAPVTRQDITNAVAANVDFFQRKWREFCKWADACAQEWHKYEAEQNGEYNEQYEKSEMERATLAWKRRREEYQADPRRGDLAKPEWKRCCPEFALWLRGRGYASFYVPRRLDDPGDLLLATKPSHVPSLPSLDKRTLLLLNCAVLSITHDACGLLEPRAPRICTWEAYKDGFFAFQRVYEDIKESLKERESSGELKRAWDSVRPHLLESETPKEIPGERTHKQVVLTDEAAKLLAQKPELKANGPREGVKKGGRKPVHDVAFWQRVRDRYEEVLATGIGSKGAWNKAAETHGIKSGDAARVQCRRYLRPKTEQ